MQIQFFTLCSNNYLAFAKTLGDSLLRHHPDAQFAIGLVDLYDPLIDYSVFAPFELLDQESIGCPDFKGMLERYDVIEFNTAVKPFYFEFLMNRVGADGKVIYLDPDIVVYRPLNSLLGLLDENAILLTPNLLNPPLNEVSLGELASLRHGMFNLGFIAVNNTVEAQKFITWWQVRLRKYCLIKKSSGLFVDQKWVDLAPLYFSGIMILRDPGYNMAWWNLDERKLLFSTDGYFVNDFEHPLYFFHFSGFSPDNPRLTSRLDAHIKLTEHNPEILDQLFSDYASRLKASGHSRYSVLKPVLKFHSAKKENRLFRLLRKLYAVLK